MMIIIIIIIIIMARLMVETGPRGRREASTWMENVLVSQTAAAMARFGVPRLLKLRIPESIWLKISPAAVWISSRTETPQAKNPWVYTSENIPHGPRNFSPWVLEYVWDKALIFQILSSRIGRSLHRCLQRACIRTCRHTWYIEHVHVHMRASCVCLSIYRSIDPSTDWYIHLYIRASNKSKGVLKWA